MLSHTSQICINIPSFLVWMTFPSTSTHQSFSYQSLIIFASRTKVLLIDLLQNHRPRCASSSTKDTPAHTVTQKEFSTTSPIAARNAASATTAKQEDVPLSWKRFHLRQRTLPLWKNALSAEHERLRLTGIRSVLRTIDERRRS